MARRVGGVGCGPLDDDCGAGFVVKRADVNRWMSESDLSFFLRNNLILASWGRNYVQVGIRNIINYIHVGIRKIDLCKLIILNLKRSEFKLYCKV